MATIRQLIQFIPKLKEDNFGEWIIDKQNDGSIEHPIQMPVVEYSDVVIRFMRVVHDFVQSNRELKLTNYLSILKTNKINNLAKSEVEKLDKQCILAIIVCCVRQERFCEGFLLENLQNGVVIKCLEQLATMESGDDDLDFGDIDFDGF